MSPSLKCQCYNKYLQHKYRQNGILPSQEHIILFANYFYTNNFLGMVLQVMTIINIKLHIKIIDIKF